jgi:hypothetical protein
MNSIPALQTHTFKEEKEKKKKSPKRMGTT